jgi:hypothetical protein
MAPSIETPLGAAAGAEHQKVYASHAKPVPPEVEAAVQYGLAFASARAFSPRANATR